jgi:hypothetical protein
MTRTHRLARAAGFALAGLLALAAPAPRAALTRAAGENFIYLGYLTRHGLPQPFALANPSFEDETNYDLTRPWPFCQYTGPVDDRDNANPPGWTYRAYDTDELMPFPVHWDNGQLVPAISGGVGENVLRCRWQLPESEWPGAEHALLLDGNWVYKAFSSSYFPWALELGQVITGPPGGVLTVRGYVMAETTHFHENGTPLEPDTWMAALRLGDESDTRNHAAMITNFDVAGSDRPWNRFTVSETFPESGVLTMTLVMQSNWPIITNFFIDDFSATLVP